jgi:hypothetical protein
MPGPLELVPAAVPEIVQAIPYDRCLPPAGRSTVPASPGRPLLTRIQGLPILAANFRHWGCWREGLLLAGEREWQTGGPN